MDKAVARLLPPQSAIARPAHCYFDTVAPETVLHFIEQPVLSVKAAINRLKAEYGGNLLAAEMRKRYSKLEDLRFPKARDGCFVAGTLVWTDNGLVPIEEIRVGDRVLSQSEDNGGRIYKRVSKTFFLENKKIIFLKIKNSEAEEVDILVTPNHPIWVSGKAWTAAELLVFGDEIQFSDGSSGWVWKNHPVSNTTTSGVGCVVDDGAGWQYYVDLRGNEARWLLDREIFVNQDDDGFRSRVYKFEVEDFTPIMWEILVFGSTMQALALHRLEWNLISYPTYRRANGLMFEAELKLVSEIWRGCK